MFDFLGSGIDRIYVRGRSERKAKGMWREQLLVLICARLRCSKNDVIMPFSKQICSVHRLFHGGGFTSCMIT